MADARAFRLGIFQKMLLVMVLVASLPLSVVWYTSFANSKQSITQSVDERLSSSARSLSGFVENWIDMNARMLRQNSLLPSIKSMVGERQEATLKSIVMIYNWNYLAFTVDRNGQNVSRSDNKGLKDYSDRSYVRQVLEGSPLGQQVLIGKTSGKPALVLATPILNPLQRVNGALAIAMTLTEISSKVTAEKLGETGFAFLLDQDGKVVAHPSEEYTSTRADLSDHPAFKSLVAGEQLSVVYSDSSGKQIIARSQRTDNGWILIVQQDYDEAFAPLIKYNQQARILLLVTLVLVIGVALLVSRQLTRPIRRLTEVADAISRGNFSQKVTDTERGDELGSLAQAIDRLGNSVRLAMDRLRRQRA